MGDVSDDTMPSRPPLPMGLNRWTLLALYLIIGFLTGSFIFNWPPTQQFYVKSGAYHWLCGDGLQGAERSLTEQDGAANSALFRGLYRQTWHSHSQQNEGLRLRRRAAGVPPSPAGTRDPHGPYFDSTYGMQVCGSQLQAVDALMPACVASMFVFALIGGLTVDLIGPKVSASIGLICQISGWLLLGFCSKQVRLYLPSSMLIGFGNDPMCLALLNAINLFPTRRGLTLSILSASRALSFIIPPVFNLLIGSTYCSFRVICLTYVTIQLLCLLAVLVLFPFRPFTPPRCEKQESKRSRTQETPYQQLPKLSAMPVPAKPLLPSSFKTLQIGKTLPPAAAAASLMSTAPKSNECFNGGVSASGDSNTEQSFLSAASTVSTLYSLSKGFHPSRVIPTSSPTRGPLDNSTSLPLGASTSWLSPSRQATPAALIMSPAKSEVTGVMSRLRAMLESMQANITRSDLAQSEWTKVLPLLPVAAITILSATFFAISAKNQLNAVGGEGVVNALTYLTPLLAIFPSVLFGCLADLRSPFIILVIMNSLACLQYCLLTLTGMLAIPRISFLAACAVVALNFVLASFTLAQFSCYVALTFPASIFGTLTGAVVMASGLFSLVVTPMCDFSSFASNYTPMNALCLCLTACNFAFLYVLHRVRTKKAPCAPVIQSIAVEVPREVAKQSSSVALSTTITETSVL